MRWLPNKTRTEEGRSEEMLQPSKAPSNAQTAPTNPTPYTPPKTFTPPMEQATIGRSVVIKGDISGAEALFIDGRVEGSVHLTDNRVTIGRNGVVKANIDAKEVVIMGEVTGNVECTDRLDIRSEGSLTGDVITRRISVEDGAVMKGSVQVKASEQKSDKNKSESNFKSSTTENFTEKPAVALAAAASHSSSGSSSSMYPGSN